MPMEASRSFGVVSRMTRERLRRSDDGIALVSVVFAHPDSLVFHDLANNFGYLRVRSGNRWDLHFAGYCKPSLNPPPDAVAIEKIGGTTWLFSATLFNDLRSYIERRHELVTRDELEGFRRNGIWSRSYRPPITTWRFSGTADLISFMAYESYLTHDTPVNPALSPAPLSDPGNGEPLLRPARGGHGDGIDWLSLRAVQLLEANGSYRDLSLGGIVEGFSSWRQDGAIPHGMGPGEKISGEASVQVLVPALATLAAGVLIGVAGNLAYDLLKTVVR